MKFERNIIAPFCVFFIVMGIGGVIVLPIVNVYFEFGKENYNRIFGVVWMLGAVTALLYSLVVLKDFTKESVPEQIVYYFLAIVFFVLIFVPIFR